MKDSGNAGPAFWAAATPVSTKIPVPMMPPIPSSVSCVAVSARRSWLPEDSCACSSAMDLVARSCRAMEAPVFFRRRLYTIPPVRANGAKGGSSAPRGPEAPAGLLDEQRPGGRVPRRQPDLPERVHAPGGDIREIERRGSRSAHARGLLRDRLQHLEVGIQIAQVRAVREARGDEGALERARLADTHAVIVEVGPRAAACGEELLAHRVVDHRVLEAAPDLTGDRHGDHRKAVQEVGRAIERIDDPQRVVRAAASALLGEKCMLRVEPADAADDVLLRGAG